MKRNLIISGEFTVSELKKDAQCTTAKPKTARQRIDALKAAGIDTSNYFPMGEEMVVRVVDGIPVQVTDDDPIYDKIAKGGYIGHYKLYRRWVMAQMFHLLRRMNKTGESFNAILQSYGYEYQWRMLENELLAQMKMEKHHDYTCLVQRQRWFNNDVASKMVDDYICKLRSYIEDNLMWRKTIGGQSVPKHTCKKIHYIRFAGKNIFVSDLNSKVYFPLQRISWKVSSAQTSRALYEAIRKFNTMRKRLQWQMKQSDTFINAYKGSGAYFTMHNLVMFHGARFNGLNEQQSLSLIEQKACEYNSESWRLMGVMKRLIKESNISIIGKIAEWKK